MSAFIHFLTEPAPVWLLVVGIVTYDVLCSILNGCFTVQVDWEGKDDGRP